MAVRLEALAKLGVVFRDTDQIGSIVYPDDQDPHVCPQSAYEMCLGGRQPRHCEESRGIPGPADGGRKIHPQVEREVCCRNALAGASAG